MNAPQDNIYMVERIVDRRWRRNRCEYLIKWQNYGPDDNTWEPKNHINPILTDQYDAEHGGPLTGTPRGQKRRSAANEPVTPAQRTRRTVQRESAESSNLSTTRRSTRRSKNSTEIERQLDNPSVTPEKAEETKETDQTSSVQTESEDKKPDETNEKKQNDAVVPIEVDTSVQENNVGGDEEDDNDSIERSDAPKNLSATTDDDDDESPKKRKILPQEDAPVELVDIASEEPDIQATEPSSEAENPDNASETGGFSVVESSEHNFTTSDASSEQLRATPNASTISTTDVNSFSYIVPNKTNPSGSVMIQVHELETKEERSETNGNEPNGEQPISGETKDSNVDDSFPRTIVTEVHANNTSVTIMEYQ